MNKPTVIICNNGFESDAVSAASGKGMPGIRTVFETVPCEATLHEQIEPGIQAVMDDIISSLTKPLTQEEESPTPPEREEHSRVAFKGSLAEVNRFFYKRGWTDGLPIVPPTEEAVAEMLAGTDLAADHVVAKIVPRMGKATVEKIAVNAVMAGALPTYMPFLIAGVQALVEPESKFGGWHASTGSLAPFWIINGPARRDLHITSGSGALSPGDIANASIGRAMGLIIKNIGGARKGIEDMGIYGNPGKYTMVLGENEENSPWEPLHVEEGYKDDENTITVSFINGFWMTIPTGTEEKGILNTIKENAPVGRRSALFLIMTPQHAKFLSDKGWTKRELAAFISGTRITMGTITTSSPSWVRILVAGGPGNMMCMVNGHRGVTKKVDLPADWENLVEKYRNLVPTYVRY
ncbi:hypothetical protein ACFL7M_07165 [Thermodesulfobacteriota bacterium]